MQIDFVTFIPSFMFVKKLHVMNMKTMNAKRLARYMKFFKNYCKIGLNLILNTNNENKKQKNEVCKEKIQTNFYFDNIWKHEHEMKQTRL
jgi:23S rRNA pseudoU1915 N3-methylase RlmH